MLKIILSFLGFLALANTATSQKVQCYKGTVIYDSEMSMMVYQNINVTYDYCEEGQICGEFRFTSTNAEGSGFVHTSFCTHPNFPLDCGILSESPGVGMVSNCTPSTCDSDGCNRFPTNVCNNGTLAYDQNGEMVVFRSEGAGYRACSQGEVCGMFRYNDFRQEFNYTNYVESGFCIDPNTPVNCSILDNYPDVGQVSNCNVETGQGETAPMFRMQVPLNRGYRCDRGVFAYTTDMQRVVYVENVTDAPCEINQVCGMFRWQNTDDSGNRSYVESGFCINPIELIGLSCEALAGFPNVNNPQNCTARACSGDFCETFTVLESDDASCPGRPPLGDLQVLPGCSLKQVLYRGSSCMAEYAIEFPFPDPETCSDIVDNAINCTSQVVQECIQFESGSDKLCPSIFDTIPAPIDFTQILKMIRQFAMNVTSAQDLEMVFESLMNGTGGNLTSIHQLCNLTEEQALMGLEMLRNFTNGVTIGIGSPVCSDNQILDDLIQWGIEFLEESLLANSTRQSCLAFDKLKARMDDAVRNRCYGLDRVGSVLSPILGPYISSIVQRAVDITKFFLLEVRIPGCEDVRYPSHLVCNQGDVVYQLEDRTFPVLDKSNVTVCPPNHACGMFRWINTDENGNVAYVESGICTLRGYEDQYTCEAVRNDPQVARADNCTFEYCDETHRCEMFSKDRCTEVPDNDIAILPRCSLRTSLDRGIGCLGSFVEGYPYSDRQQCRMQVDSTVRCARDVMQRCLSGDCETVLDFIPGLRDIYRHVALVSRNINSLAEGLKLLNLDDSAIEMIYGGICGDETVRKTIVELLRGLDLDFPPTPNPVCDSKIFNDLARWGIDAAIAVLSADSHADFCGAFSTLRNNLITAWETRCSEEGLVAYLRSVLPPQFSDQLLTALSVVREFLINLEIPNCDQTGLIDCSRFYEGTTSCSMRRAWLCDYVNWKIEFFSVWFRSFRGYVDRNMILDSIPLIETCLNFDTTNFCTNPSQLKCRTDMNCRYCYCEDHRYVDFSKVMRIYKHDYSLWKIAMGRYQRATQNQETCTLN